MPEDISDSQYIILVTIPIDECVELSPKKSVESLLEPLSPTGNNKEDDKPSESDKTKDEKKPLNKQEEEKTEPDEEEERTEPEPDKKEEEKKIQQTELNKDQDTQQKKR